MPSTSPVAYATKIVHAKAFGDSPASSTKAAPKTPINITINRYLVGKIGKQRCKKAPANSKNPWVPLKHTAEMGTFVIQT